MNIGDMLNSLSQFDDNQTVELVTTTDLVAKLTGGDTFPRFLNGGFGSYRGYYCDMHIGYDLYDNGLCNNVGKLKETLNNALTQGEMYGYKGGDYVINEHTKVWVATDYGNCSNMYVSSIREVSGSVFVILGEDSGW